MKRKFRYVVVNIEEGFTTIQIQQKRLFGWKAIKTVEGNDISALQSFCSSLVNSLNSEVQFIK